MHEPYPPREPPPPPGHYYGPGPGPGYPASSGRSYPSIKLTTQIIRMVGALIIFVGVLGIAFWISDLGSSNPAWDSTEEMFENLGNNVLLIGVGGIIISVSYLISGIAEFMQGKFETSKQ